MASWLRRIWSPSRAGRPLAGPSTSIDGRTAVLEVERRYSDSLVFVPNGGVSRAVFDFVRDHRGSARPVIAEGGGSGCLEAALGLAMAGQRVAAFVPGDELDLAGGVLSVAASRMTPLLAHAWLDGHPQDGGHASWHRLEGSGALLAMASSAEEALDLSISLRIASESALCPAVLAVDGVEEAPVSLPDWQTVAATLGRSHDDVRSPTPTQVDVFGRDRRRVPSWLDPVHPLSLGQPANLVDASMMSAGRSVLFGGDVTRLVRASMSQVRDLIGRPVSFLRRHLMDDAQIVLVAQGAVVPTAERVANALREEKGWKVGVLGVTWLSPFPAADLAADIGERRAVFVIERTTGWNGDEPPLVRRVRAAVGPKAVSVVSAISSGAPVREQVLKAVCASTLERLTGSKNRGDRQALLDHTIRLDIALPAEPSQLPRRAAMESRVKANHPELAAQISMTTIDGDGGDTEQERCSSNGLCDKDPPGLLKRVGKVRIAPDSLPRVWGEVLAPRRQGPWPTTPDPIVASGAVPALSSALLREAKGGSLPVIKRDGCTACGHCWTFCPEGAIGVSVLGLADLLDSASALTGQRGEAADALKRAHPHIAKRAASRIDAASAGVLARLALEDAWKWAAPRLGIAEDTLEEHDAIFGATLDQVERLRPVVTPRFFHGLSGDAPAAEVLVMGVSEQACTGCGLCARECPEAVVTLSDAVAFERSEPSYSSWESVADTSGATCARAANEDVVGPMAARLLSRHAAQAMVPAGIVPGSGEALAARLLAAIAEHSGQVQVVSLEKRLSKLHKTLDEVLRRQLTRGLVDADIEHVARALDAGDTGSLRDLADTLDRQGARTKVDREKALAMAELIQRLDKQRRDLVNGADGLGRARFSVVLAGKALAERLAPYPVHPFFSPLVVETSLFGATTIGLAEATARRHLQVIRDLRRAEIEIDSPADKPGRIEANESLCWSDLSLEEMSSCPPLLVFVDEAFLANAGSAFASRLLVTDLPIKLILLDGLQPDRRPDPCLVAIAHQYPFVLATSIGHPDHLSEGFAAALTHPGPALVHVHAPVPSLHGFEENATIERARAAVRARAHVLLRYDPYGEGELGLRLSLSHNPALDSELPELSITDWALGEARFGKNGEELSTRAAAAYEAKWRALLELSGRRSILAARIEGEVRQKVARESEEIMAERLVELEATQSARVASAMRDAEERLTERLLELTVAGMEGR